jgi:hypothetical protein
VCGADCGWAVPAPTKERIIMTAPRTPDEIEVGIREASAALDGGDVACAAYLLGVPVEDVQRVAGPTV